MITAKITRMQFDQLTDWLRSAEGVEVPGDRGTILKQGVQAEYNFDGSTLTVDVVGKPFFLSTATVEAKLREALAWHGVKCA